MQGINLLTITDIEYQTRNPISPKFTILFGFKMILTCMDDDHFLYCNHLPMMFNKHCNLFLIYLFQI